MSEPITIKTEEEIQLMREAGKILAQVHETLAKEIHEGMSTLDVDKLGEEVIRSYGCEPNFKGLYGYPASVCVSVNDEVVHGIPRKTRILEEGDIISVDVGAVLNGYQSDACRTYMVGEVAPEVKDLVERTEKSFWIGLEYAKAGMRTGDIGHAIKKHCKKYGYGIVRDLAGHGVGLHFHEEPDVDHDSYRGTGMLLVPGMVFTIEPMINMGTWRVFIDSDDPYGWEVITEDEKPSAQWEHTLLMTEHGVEILTY